MPEVTPVVFILESPHPRDLLIGRFEGKALGAALELGGIEHHYCQVNDLEHLVLAFRMIEDHLGQFDRHAPSITIPMIHFSCHGNEDGICLTSNEDVSWQELGELLWNLGTCTNRINVLQRALLVANFSSCDGAACEKLLTIDPLKKPVVGAVGPVGSVDWSDALTAYIVYYHLVLNKQWEPPKAVGPMNAAAGLDGIFKLFAINPPTLGVENSP